MKFVDGNLLQADPGASGLACVVDGKVLARPDISKDRGGEVGWPIDTTSKQKDKTKKFQNYLSTTNK